MKKLIKQSWVDAVLIRVRYLASIAVIFSFLSSMMVFYVGAKKTIFAIIGYFQGVRPDLAPEHMKAENIVIIQVIDSIDSFLLALVLLYFGYGIYALFLHQPDAKVIHSLPKWLVVKNLGQLKETLGQVIIIILLVLFLQIIWLNLLDLTWQVLVLPIAIALLALAMRLVGFREKEDDDDDKK